MKSMVGIEQINVYSGSMVLDLEDLARIRGDDIEHVKKELMVLERTVIPPWEDTVTMAVNAAKPILTEKLKKQIGLLIVATETGLDQEKSVSSWVHKFLGLQSDCRNFELKSACYSGTAAMKIALAWLLSDMADDSKVLLITSDKSLMALGEPYEYITGAGAVAIIISKEPNFLIIEHEKYGIHAQEVSDVIRPLPWVETGNSGTSLFSYMDCLVDSYDAYQKKVNNESYDKYFDYNIYHMPFAGISYRAHKRILDLDSESSLASFQKKTYPSIIYPQRIGATYGGCIFIAMLSLIDNVAELNSGERIGVFSYGSGACSEYYSAIITEKSKNISDKVGMLQKLDARFSISVDHYDQIEKMHSNAAQLKNFSANILFIDGLFDYFYAGKNLLFLSAKENYYRFYEWS